MQVNRLLGAAALAAALLPWCSSARADDDNSTKKPDAAEKAPPNEVTTQSTIDVGNQHIAYTSIAGTITVGATDTDDAQLGMDGKPLAGSQLAISAPKEAKDAPPVARMFYVAYFKKDVKAEDRPITFFYNGGPGSATRDRQQPGRERPGRAVMSHRTNSRAQPPARGCAESA